MSVIDTLTTQLFTLSQVVPLEAYTFIGALVEEVVAPIPSPFVMTSVGSLVAAQGNGWWYLFVASLIGAVGKTLGSAFVYWIGDKGEDVVIGRFGRLFGVSHREIEKVGQYFRGDWRDDAILLLIRSLPVVPSSPISVACGVLRVPFKSFLWTTMVGSFVRNMLYLFIGYEGVEAYASLLAGLDSAESFFKIFMLGAGVALAAWFYYQRRKEDDSLVGRIRRWLRV